MSEVNQKDTNKNLDESSKEIFEMSSETSSFVNDLLSDDIFDNTSNKNESHNIINNISVLNNKSNDSQESNKNTDTQKQDLLRRMILQEKITESILTKTLPGTLKSKTSVAPPPPPPPIQNKSTIIKENSINIEEMSFSNLSVFKSNKKDVISIMEQKSKIKPEYSDENFNYSDLGISFLFNENELIKEIIFSHHFIGETSSGLKLNDTIDKAIELYGLPKMQTAFAALWNNFFVFFDDSLITSIRIKPAH